MTTVFLLALIFLAVVSPCRAETYADWLATCKSYKDVAEWLAGNFQRDAEVMPQQGPDRLRAFPVRSAEEIFRRKAGLPLEAASFTRDSLNRIDPAYRARVIHVTAGPSFSHYVCGFYLGGRLFIVDFANPHERRIGTHGPFRTPAEYALRMYPAYKGVRATAHFETPEPARRSRVKLER